MDNEKIEELKAKVESDPKSRLFVPLADEYRKAGMLDEAIEVLKQGIERQPNYTGALAALGKIFFEKKMYAEARAEFEKVVQLVPDHMSAHRKLADIYREQGERDLAIEQYRRALKLNPMDEEAQSILEELSKPPAAVPEPAVEVEEEVSEEVSEEDEDVFLSMVEAEAEDISGEFEPAEELTPIEDMEEAEAEFLEAFEAEAAPVDEVFEMEEEAEPLEELAETFEGADEEEFLTAVEEAEPAGEISDALEDTAEEEEFLDAAGEELFEAEEAAEAIEAVEEAAETEEAVEEVFEAAEEMEEVGEEAFEVEEEPTEAIEAAETVEAAEAEEVVEVEPPGEEVFEEAGFGDLAAVTTDDEETTFERCHEYVAQGEYAKAADIYKEILAGDPENIKAKQGLQEIETLLKLVGTEKEVIIGRLEAFLRAIKKRKNELYRNA